MTRYSYNRQIDPPAPFVHVTVKQPTGDAAIADVPAQLDTAADVTVLPRELVDQLRLVQLGDALVQRFGGQIVSNPTFLVEIAIRSLPIEAVVVLASEVEPHVLLGRDVLNRHALSSMARARSSRSNDGGARTR